MPLVEDLTLYLWRDELRAKSEQISALEAQNARLRGALKGMTDLWENIGKSIPPLLNEEPYKAAIAILKEK